MYVLGCGMDTDSVPASWVGPQVEFASISDTFQNVFSRFLDIFELHEVFFLKNVIELTGCSSRFNK